jgi:hypothetical protein
VVWVWKWFILKGFIGGPDRDRTDDLFHAISAASRNSLKLHDINRAETRPDAHIFPVIGPLMDPPDRLQWNAATECNVMLPLAAFPSHPICER